MTFLTVWEVRVIGAVDVVNSTFGLVVYSVLHAGRGYGPEEVRD